MCNLISVGRNRKRVLTIPGIPAPPEQPELPLYYVASAFDTPPLPVLRADREWELAKWGLVPHWTRTVAQAKKIRAGAVNARSESMWERPAFELAARNGRCLILVDGFFEFHHHLGVAFPFYIYLGGHPTSSSRAYVTSGAIPAREKLRLLAQLSPLRPTHS